MNTYAKLAVIAAVALAAGVIVLSGNGPGSDPADAPSSVEDPATPAPQSGADGRSLPRLVDLGAEGCIPCKMMEPVLKELENEYRGRLEVEFINIAQDRASAEQYGVKVIPTQVFFNAEGEEIARHQGFMSKEEIISFFENKGVSIEPGDDRSE